MTMINIKAERHRILKIELIDYWEVIYNANGL